MAQITGGSVTFGRTVQPAQYESKKSEVTITFAVAEDDKPEDALAILGRVKELAQTTALEMVGLKPKAAEPVAAAPKEADKSAPDPLANVVDEDRPGARRGRKPKLAEDPLAAAEKTAEADNEAAEATAHKEAMAKANANVADADADLLGGGPPQPVSDKELMDAVTKKMDQIKNGPAIKAVREKFVASPHGIRDIPQDKRREFLEELSKLK